MAPLRLLAQLRQAIRVRHYSRRTEEAYVFWVRRYVRFCGLRHPGDLGPRDVREFLTALAERERLSAASQNQAASALVFLYERVLGRRLESGAFDGVVRAKEGQRLPIILTRDEVHRVLAELSGVNRLVAQLLYGSGLRLLEALELRVKDRYRCPGRWRGRYLGRCGTGRGSGCFLRRARVNIPRPAIRSGIIGTNPRCSWPCAARCWLRGSRSGPGVTRFGTRSRRI